MRINVAILNVGIVAGGALAVVFALIHGRESKAAPGGLAHGAAANIGSVFEAAKQASPYDFYRDIEPLLEEYCYDCHGDGASKGGLVLDEWEDERSLMRDRKIWKQVAHHVDLKVMPPAKREAPSDEQRKMITTWIDKEVFYVDCSKPDPGRVTIRRLNRQEYNNTIRDLVGVDFKPAADFPPDDSGYGFDNIGDVLSLSPLLLEKYLAAAEKIMDEVIRTTDPAPPTRSFRAQELTGGHDGGNERILSTNGRVGAEIDIPRDGTYTIRIRASAHQAGDEAAKMSLVVGGKTLKTFEVKNEPGDPKTFEFKVRLKAKRMNVGAEFINDFYNPKAKDPNRRDRNLLVARIEIDGPEGYKGPGLSKFQIRELPADTSKIDRRIEAAKILERFASRAFRRPVQKEEVDRLLILAREGGKGRGKYGFEKGLKLAMTAVLVSPNFLFRNELQPEPDNPAAVYRLNEFALASRLSYLVWSSMPDAELFRLAREGGLRKNWEAQVSRMLADPKSRALTENFAGQWLQLRDLDLVTPDREKFRSFDGKLRASMRVETEKLFEHIVRQDRSLMEFLSADYTFADETLARHYGIKGVKGDEFRRVSLEGSRRAGILTHASILTLTSNPTRTSPVKRGKWILENILGTPPPDPPANIPPLDSKGESKGTIRQMLEQHRADPNCASCHALMDPVGLAFEHFDAIGRFRDQDGGQKIDASGVLGTGEKIRDSADLRSVLVGKQSEQFVRTLSEAMLTYALGRGLEYYDRCAVDQIVDQVKAGEFKFSQLILSVSKSVPFQMRRGDGERE